MPNITSSLPNIAILLTVLIMLVLFIKEYKKRRDLEKTLPESTIKKAEERSLNIIHKAKKQALSILGRAEEKNNELEQEYSKQMAKLTTASQVDFAKYLEELKAKSEQAQSTNQQLLYQQANEVFDRFEKNLAAFLSATEQKSITSIEMELKTARQLVESYKTQQLAMIDENIIAMLEKTLSLVLTKKITLKDEMDLVYEALEKAKVENFVV